MMDNIIKCTKCQNNFYFYFYNEAYLRSKSTYSHDSRSGDVSDIRPVKKNPFLLV